VCSKIYNEAQFEVASNFQQIDKIVVCLTDILLK